MIDNLISKIMNFIFPHQNRFCKDGKLFWDKHWGKMIQYFQKNGEIFEIHNKWDFHCNKTLHNHYKLIVKKFKNPHGFNGVSCFECGCGGGYESTLMTQEGAIVSILDYSTKALEYAQIVAQRMGVLNKIKFIHDDVFNFIPKNKFDLVWNCGVAEHYKNEEIIEMIKKMSIFAKENGLVMVTVPNLLSPQSIYWMLKEGKGSEGYISHKKLIVLMKMAGLKNVQIKTLDYWLPSFLPYTWAIKTSKLRFFSRLKFLTWLFTGIGTKT